MTVARGRAHAPEEPVLHRYPGARRKARLAVILVLVSTLLCSLATSCRPGLTTEEKLADFRYLFEIFRDNYPYLELKARSEGYDWLPHESEFEEWIRESRNDVEFAQAIQRILMMLNQRHTTVMAPQIYEMVSATPSEMKPWHDEAAKTDAKTVARWYGYLSSALQYPKGQGLPFRAWYCQGEYVVYWVLPDFSASDGVLPGDTVLSINGQPVHEFVEGMRGLTWLRLDPLRDRLYLT
ncbi:MAG: hypothetical protein GX863_06360, partial [Firmicutes bacterium]|nr:hypothetical protein [Candidatus Fermentithermobacillaceae bacterium]